MQARSMDAILMEIQRKKIGKKEHHFSDVWDNMTQLNICVIRDPEGKERKNGAEKTN